MKTTLLATASALLLAAAPAAQHYTFLIGRGALDTTGSTVLPATWAATNQGGVSWSGTSTGCSVAPPPYQEVWMQSQTAMQAWVQFDLPAGKHSAFLQLQGDGNDGYARIQVRFAGASNFTHAGDAPGYPLHSHWVYLHSYTAIASVKVWQRDASPDNDVAICYCAYEGPARHFCQDYPKGVRREAFAQGRLYAALPDPEHCVDLGVGNATPLGPCLLVLSPVPSTPYPILPWINSCVWPMASGFALADPSGVARYRIPGINDSALEGVSLYSQWFGLDPPFTIMDVWSSQAMQLTFTY